MVTPNYLKFKSKDDKQAAEAAPEDSEKPNVSNPKITVKNQSAISAQKLAKNNVKLAYGTVGTSPEVRAPQSRIDRQNAPKSLSNNSRQKYQTQH